ncbi:MAG: DUF4338 domain-containing protein [Candidatus Schekmanbacteria bacterium]|nr:DUF4338 domain-containing protein [Candidatus Schekmanbacteria bacterium]
MNLDDFPQTFRGRLFTAAEIRTIRQLLAEQPQLTRRALSLEICRLLQWRQVNGRPKDRACRVVLLELHRRGVIELPPPKCVWQRRNASVLPAHEEIMARPVIEVPLRDLRPIVLRCVSSNTSSPSADERLWNQYVARYHFLGYHPLAGAQLKYLLESRHGTVGCLSFGAAAWRVKARDAWIGWSCAQRQSSLHRIVSNGRFLLFPWVHAKFLASHVLASAARQLPSDWLARYGYRPALIETFVHRDRHRGTCYAAANWLLLGETAGRGKWGGKPGAVPVKLVYVYPLLRNYLSILRGIPSELPEAPTT